MEWKYSFACNLALLWSRFGRAEEAGLNLDIYHNLKYRGWIWKK